MRNIFAEAIRSLSRIGRGPLGLLAMAVILGAATGAALAQDEGNAPAVEPAQATEVADTSSTTTDVLDATTTAEDLTTVADDTEATDTDGEGSADAPASDLTTTTSDDLNSVGYSSTKVAGDKTPPTFAADCKEGGFGDEVTPPGTKTQVVDGVTLTFEFFQVAGGDTSSGVKVSASAPFTGEILIKSSTTDTTHPLVITGTGHTVTFTSPSQNQNGVYQNISHVCVKGTGSTTTGTTSTGSTTTTETTATTSTTSTTTSTPSTTTTSTPSTTTTGSTAGTTAAGTQPAGVAGTTGGGGNAGKQAAQGVAAEAATSSGGGLPFTGLHAPILILMGLTLAGAGFVLRRRLKDVS